MNDKNGKSASKIPKWPSLRLPELKSKFTRTIFRKLRGFVGKRLLESKALLTSNILPNESYCFKNSDCHKFSFSDDGTSDLAILISSTYFFHFWHSLSYSQ